MIYIPIYRFDEAAHHLCLSGLPEGSAACQVLIEPHLHHSIIIYPDHPLLHWEKACPPGQLRESFERSIEDVQVIRIRDVFNVLKTDGDAFDEQGMPGSSRAEIILGVRLEVVCGYKQRIALAYLIGLPFYLKLLIILSQDFILLKPLPGLGAAFPDLELFLLLSLLPIGLAELIVIYFAILAAH